MPYFIYRIHEPRRFERLTSIDRYRDARVRARELRAAQRDDDASMVRVIYAVEESEAERLLAQKREAPPLGDE